MLHWMTNVKIEMVEIITVWETGPNCCTDCYLVNTWVRSLAHWGLRGRRGRCGHRNGTDFGHWLWALTLVVWKWWQSTPTTSWLTTLGRQKAINATEPVHLVLERWGAQWPVENARRWLHCTGAALTAENRVRMSKRRCEEATGTLSGWVTWSPPTQIMGRVKGGGA